MSEQKPPDLAATRRALLEKRKREQGLAGGVERISPRPDSQARPLSFAEERLWLLDQLDPGRAVYNVVATHRLHGPLDRGLLGRALHAVLERHEALTTSFPAGPDGEPRAVVAPAASIALLRDDRPRLEPPARTLELRRLAETAARRPFAMAEPLFRAELVRFADDDHGLILSLHHAITDRWSMGILFRELSAAYRGLKHDGEASLGPRPLGYGDFAHHQRNTLTGVRLEGLLGWWREFLRGAPTVLDLPADRPRTRRASYHGAKEYFRFKAPLSDAIRALARKLEVTPFQLLLAALGAVIARYTGSRDLVIGAPVFGRDQAELENVIGLFVNTVAIRLDLSGDPSFRELALRARESAFAATAHQALPFASLVQELAPERDLARSPIVQVMLAVHAGRPDADLSFADVKATAVEVESGTSKLDLTWFVADGEPELHGAIEYTTDLYHRGRVQRLLRHLENLLDHAIREPHSRLSRLTLLDDAERSRVVAEWNRTGRAFSGPDTLHAVVEDQVDRTPDAIALWFAGRTLTYRELDTRANQLAHHLRARGVGPEVTVAVCLERSLELVVTLLAILKAGGAWVPLDPSYPEERLRYMIGDADAGVVVTESGLAARVSRSSAKRVIIDRERDAIASESSRRPGLAMSGENLAYIIYTSGSTGRPKGAMNRHRAIVNRLRWMQDEYRLDPRDRVLQKTPMGFDVSVWEFFWPLLAGATEVIARPGGHQDPHYLRELIASEAVTTAHFVPSLLAVFLDETSSGALPSLRRVIVSGEALTSDVRDRFLARLPQVELHNLYGPTECAVDVTFTRVDRGAITIGRPIANTRMYVLDDALNPSPIGVPGDLYIGGEALGRGYHRRPDLTADRFLPDGVSGEPGAQLYRTGDRARFRDDGQLEYLGRSDFQVKLRGFRIELGEIEAAILRLTAARECAVLLRQVGGESHLVAYVAPGQITIEALHQALAPSLPTYMLPWRVVVLDRLPLTPNGKLDRAALPLPAADAHAGEQPGDPAEAEIALVFAECLRVEVAAIGRHDDFFARGGHSLLAARLAARLRAKYGVALELAQVFETPTVAGLAATIAELAKSATPPADAIGANRGDRPRALSFAQERLWFLQQFDPTSATYNVPSAWRLRGGLDVNALGSTIAGLFARHEVLRSVFVSADGETRVTVLPIPEGPLGIEQVTDLETARRLASEEALRPFDLSREPPLRCRLLRIAADDHILMLTLHHMACDGWSFGILRRELAADYARLRQGLASHLAPASYGYADFAAWQREALSGESLAREVSWWRDQLAAAPTLLDLPTDRPRQRQRDGRGDTVRFTLSPALSDDLKALSRAADATLFVTLLSGFAAVLGRLADADQVVIGSPVAGRDRVEWEPVIGCFMNTLALNVDLRGRPGFLELVRRTRAGVVSTFRHGALPFEKLVEELSPVRDPSRTPIFQVLLALQNTGTAPLELAELECNSLVTHTHSAKFDLSIYFAESGAGLVGALEYATALFDRATIERLIETLRVFFAAAVQSPTTACDRLPLRDPQAIDPAALRWHSPLTSELGLTPVPIQITDIAARTPERVAVVHRDQSLSYAELMRRADDLAAILDLRGIGRGDIVGVAVSRSLELPIALVAVWLRGAAYLPLDPTLPAARLRFMVNDAGPRAIVVDDRTANDLRDLDVTLVNLTTSPSQATSPATIYPTPEDAAYLIYTSGSTGQPKGVRVPHRALANFIDSMRAAPGLSAEDVVVAVTTISFDIAALELFLPLTSGARVVIADSDVAASPGELNALLEHSQATVLQATPVTWRMLVESGFTRPRLRALCGGEALPPDLAATLILRVAELWNLYGPTETTVWSALARVDREAIAITTPVAGTTVSIIDNGGQTVPVGVAGELVIGGVGLAHGYHARPDLTAERFVPDPDSATPGGRRYRSGDLARLRPDLSIELLGRLDHQVKMRGFRIELGEIEARLGSHPEVNGCVVIARGDELVAYYVGAAQVKALRDHLAETLPAYMVPGRFIALAAMPRNPSGKIERKLLPEPTSVDAPRDLEAPSTPTEVRLAAIWRALLRRESIGRDDDLFLSGGHSLLATRLVARVRDEFRVALALRAIFDAPTLREVAARIDRLPTIDDDPIARFPDRESWPLSAAQARLWFLDRLEPNTAVYNLPVARRLNGHLDADALARAFAKLVARHDQLRASFPALGGRPQQKIGDGTGIELRRLDCSRQDQVKVLQLITQEAQRPFDLSSGPLFRATLYRLADDHHLLAITCHHIVADGWSLGLLFRDLTALYRAERAGLTPELAALPVRYVDHASWQLNRLTGTGHQEALARIREQLAGAPDFIALPIDRPRPPVLTYTAASHSRQLPVALEAALADFGRRESATPFMILFAAFAALLGRHAGQDDLVIGSPIAGRSSAAVDDVVGCFLNTIALRVDLAGAPSLLELVAQIKTRSLQALADQDMPFESVLEALRPARDLSRTPLFQVFFNYLSLPHDRIALDDLVITPLAAPEIGAKFDLTLYAHRSDGKTELRATYRTDLFDQERIAELLDQLQLLLAAALAAPARPLREHRLITLRANRLPDPNQTLDASWRGTVFAAIAEHARLQPQVIAVRDHLEEITYETLVRRSRRIARALCQHGIERGDVVAIWAHRGRALVPAVVGVLEAGGAFLTIDPDYPGRLTRSRLETAKPVALLRLREADELPEEVEDYLAATRLRAIIQVDADGGFDGDREYSEEPLGIVVGADDAASLVFTSGSTGTPKAVVGRHGGLTHFAPFYARRFGIGPGDRFTMLAGLGHDPLQRDLFTPLLAGATVVIPDPARIHRPGYLYRWMIESGITFANLSPAMAQLLSETAGEPRTHEAKLRVAFFFGDVLRRRHVSALQALFPNFRAVSLYGTTESHRALSHYVVEPDAHADDKAIVPLGHGIDDVQLLVLTADRQRAAIGEVGELAIRSPHLARGYLDDDTLTAARFVGDRYLTGDLGRYRLDGEVEFVGRADHQVKVRGFRVELGEIEATLASAEGVREAVVVARPDSDGSSRLIAYIAGDDLSTLRLRGHLRDRLPEFMIPSRLMVLGSLPKTATGKVALKALPAPEAERGAAKIAPRTKFEQAVFTAWADVLATTTIGIHDNFFDLGGHSLQTVVVIDRLQAELHCDLRPRDLFLNTLEQVAKRCEETATSPSDLPSPLSLWERGRG